MKKILPILFAATVLLTPLYPVYAQSTDVAAPVKRIAKPTAATAAAKLEAAKAKLQDEKPPAMEKVATRAAELKAKLAKFRDKAKATRVETINTNLNAVNTRRTTQMQTSLDKISQVLAKLKTWVAQQETAGKDVSSLKSAITSTETAWAEAGGAVKAQAAKDYTIVVNTESTVKADAQTARDSLHGDLKAVHDKIVNVRQTLASALAAWGGNN